MKITQQQAREARARVRILEGRIRAMTGRTGGYLVNIASVSVTNGDVLAAVRTASKLGHAVIVHIDAGNGLTFSALPEAGL